VEACVKNMTRRELLTGFSKDMLKKTFRAYSEFNNAANPSGKESSPENGGTNSLLETVKRIDKKFTIGKEG